MKGRTAIAMAALPVGGLLAAAWLAVASGSEDPVTRTYYIAADEVEWDYAPSGRNAINDLPFSEIENVVMKNGPDRIGRVYLKALYREYTDSTFTTLAPRPPEWKHLGFLGPLLRAQEGDTIRVVFRNNARFPASVHPHGVFYDKDSEGAPSADGTSGADRADDGVPPGGTHVYVWAVPERAGPAAGDGSSVLWMYHSHVNEERDVNSALLGPMIVTAREKARADGSPEDVDREIVVAFAEVDENLSWYLDHNIDAYAGDPASVPRDEIQFFQP
ncbi:MAG: multicopper oxidase domain-containing protein, partial [Gemmatimonadota bacterium]